MAATDPGQPFGASLPWPESGGRPSRSAGALVILHDGEPMVFLERGGKSLLSFDGAQQRPEWAMAIAQATAAGRTRLEITKIDGEPAATSPLIAHLEAAGFQRGYRGWSIASPTR